MRFRSVRVQRLPLFAQVIAIFKKELHTIDVFRSFFPVGGVLEHERDRRGIFSKSLFARNRAEFERRVLNFVRLSNYFSRHRAVGIPFMNSHSPITLHFRSIPYGHKERNNRS